MSQDAYRDEKEAARSRVDALKRELRDATERLRALPGSGLMGQATAGWSEADHPDPPPSRLSRLLAWWRTKRSPEIDLCPDCGKDSPGPGQDCLYCGWVCPFPEKKDPVPPPGGSGGVKPDPHPPNGIVMELVGPDNIRVQKLGLSRHPEIVQLRREQVVDYQGIHLGSYVHVLGGFPQPQQRISESPGLQCPNCGADGQHYSKDLGWCRACNYTDSQLAKGLGSPNTTDPPDPLYTCPSCGETNSWSPGLRWCKVCKYEEGEIPTEPVDLAGLSGEDLADLWSKPPDISKAFRRGGKVGTNEQHRPRQPLPLNRGGKVR